MRGLSMVKKREMNETMIVEDGAVIELQEVQDAAPLPAENEDPDYANLLDVIQEVRKRKDVVGYILKGEYKASIDVNDSSKIIEYAMLSSQSFETAKTLAETFRIGDTENILIEGKNIKMICLYLGQNKISIFMEKGADHTLVLRAFAPKLELTT
jgi:predicted regulator of Ras-like GTPase activity (Roadblock/LC7/MglB family)